MVNLVRARSRALVLVAMASLCLVTLAGCSGSGKSTKTKSTKPVPITSSVALRLTGTSVESAGPNVAFPIDVRNRVAQVVNQYVEKAVVAAMRTGIAAAGLTGLFTADAGARLKGPDRSVLTDDGVLKASGSISSSTANLALTALADTSGKIVLVSAGLLLDLHTTVAGGPLRIVRNGDLLLAPAAGTWQVAGYDLTVLRAGSGVQAARSPRRAVLAA